MGLDNYPPGAANDPTAPYNEPPSPEVMEFEVTVSQSLSKSTTVLSDQYDHYRDEDEDGYYDWIETENINWNEAYEETPHLTIEGLLEKFKEMLEEKVSEIEKQVKDNKPDHSQKKKLDKLNFLIEECQGWTLDESEVVKDD